MQARDLPRCVRSHPDYFFSLAPTAPAREGGRAGGLAPPATPSICLEGQRCPYLPLSWALASGP